MRKTRRFAADLESLEGKALLSTVPFLSQNTFNQMLHQIDMAAGSFAKTRDAIAFDTALSQISSKVPYGHSQLFPTWQTDEGIYHSTVPGSGVKMVKQLKSDLKGYVQSSVVGGTMSVSGNWLGLNNPAATTVTTVNVPVLSMKTYTSAFAQIDRAAGTFAKTHNAVAFDAALSNISSSFPHGHNRLYPEWQADEGIYSVTIAGSGMSMIKQIKADLVSYVQTSVADGSMRIR